MSIKTVPTSQMKVNRIIKRIGGSLFELVIDSKDVVKAGNVINEELYNKYIEGIKEEQEANKAAMYAAQESKTEETSTERVDKLEVKVEAIDTKLDAIMNLLKK